MTHPSLEVIRYLSRRRSRKTARSRARVTKRYNKAKLWRRLNDLAFGQHSKIIDMLAKHAKRRLPASPYGIDVHVGKQFSIIDDPQGAIDLICSFAFALKHGKRIRHINFNHGRLESYDLAANAILDLVAVERKAELRSRGSGKGLSVSGVYPTDQPVRRFIKAMGIIKHMGIVHEAPSRAEAQKLRFFDARNKHYRLNPDANSADYKDRQQAKFVEFIDSCLRTHNWELSDHGKLALVNYAGEILSNAEDHADFVDWSVLGYLDTGAATPTCEIAIFNFGKSIAETLSELDRGSYAWGRLKAYIDAHSAKRLFGTSWREEDLLTVVALQQHISSKNYSDEDTRGQGTVHFIDFFQEAYEFCKRASDDGQAKMAIVSGGTYIFFDGKHRLTERTGLGKTIAFNDDNDLTQRPDPKYVKGLDGVHFPGTIISVRFPLTLGEGAMVEEIQDEKDEN